MLNHYKYIYQKEHHKLELSYHISQAWNLLELDFQKEVTGETKENLI